jgi:hypothetical protein
MSSPETASASGPSLAQAWLHALRYWLRGRRGVVGLLVLVALMGLVLNWSWLVAAGIAPLLLTALPCALMCGLGLCMNRTSGSAPDAAHADEQERAAGRATDVRRLHPPQKPEPVARSHEDR